jgi:hypothetical protein
LVFEIYAHRPASGDPKGRQLQRWQVPLAAASDQQSYWSRSTRCYEIPLKVNIAALPQQSKFVLVGRYTNPWNEHLEDEAIMDLAGLISELKADLRDTGEH